MPIRFACAQCGSRVKTPDGSGGKKMKCPRCGHLQRVPEKTAEPHDPPTQTPATQPPSPKSPDEPAPPATTPDTPPDTSPDTNAETRTATETPAHDTATQAPTTAANGDDALAALAAARDQDGPDSESTAPETADDDEQAQAPSPNAPSPTRPRPTPQPAPAPMAPAEEGPRSIPLSSARPRPMPRPRPANGASDSSTGTALSAQVGSATPSAPEARARSIDVNAGDMPTARTRRQAAQLRGRLSVLAWVSYALAVVIAAGAVEWMLDAGRNDASVLTQVIYLVAGLAVAGIAVVVGQIAAAVRASISR